MMRKSRDRNRGSMDRREFIKIISASSFVAANAGLLGKVWAGPPAGKKALISVVKGTESSKMIRKVLEPWGGMSYFVREGARVVIKPNAAWDRTPEQAANTNPGLVAEVIRLCHEAGAGSVLVVEHPCDRYQSSFQISGIEEAVNGAGAKMKPLAKKDEFVEVTVEKGVVIKKTAVGREILEADVLINMPVAKSHGSATLTMAMKNHMGAVWDRWAMHKGGLHQAIADVASVVRPTVNIMDALQIMTDRGPKGPGPLLRKNIVAASTDQVALDSYGATLFGMSWREIPYIVKADEMGLGTGDLNLVDVRQYAVPA